MYYITGLVFSILLAVGSETVDFRVVWNKKNFDITFSLDEKISKLKLHLQTLIGTVSYF